MVVISAPLGWFAWKLERLRAQREAIQAIESLGGSAVYDLVYSDVPLDASGEIVWPGPAWLRQVLGDDAFVHVVDVRLAGIEVTASHLKCLEGLPRCRLLDLSSAKITDAALVALSGRRGSRHTFVPEIARLLAAGKNSWAVLAV
jgi:hypothetical protein